MYALTAHAMNMATPLRDMDAPSAQRYAMRIHCIHMPCRHAYAHACHTHAMHTDCIDHLLTPLCHGLALHMPWHPFTPTAAVIEVQ